MVISKDLWRSTYCRAFGNGAVNTCIKDIGLLGLGFKHTTFHLQGNALIHCTTTAVWWSYPCSVLLWYWIQSVYILFTGGGDDRILVQYSCDIEYKVFLLYLQVEVMIVSLFSTPVILITKCLYSIYRWRWWSYPCSVLLWYWLQSVYILFTGGGDDRILVQYSREWYPDTGQLPNPRPVPDTAGHRGSLSLLCQKGLLS